MQDASLHVVFGAGQVGTPLAEWLLALGHRVRDVRTSDGSVPHGAELARGDATDEAFCIEVSRGARALYHCLGPPPGARAWAELVPRFSRSLATAAARAKARLVVLDDLSTLALGAGRRLDEDTPVAPTSRRGEIRARAAERLIESHRRGEIRAVIGRASHLYGAGGEHTVFGRAFWDAALRGKRVLLPLDLNTPHTYHHVRDVAAGLAVLGTSGSDVLGRVFMLPCVPAVSTRRLVELMAGALGQPIAVKRRFLSLLVSSSRLLAAGNLELGDSLHQWDQPFVVDDRKFRARFPGVIPTSLEAGARETVEWAVERFAPRAAAISLAPTLQRG
jgi:nucleoside-diphosphate-sugar epimerase